MKKINFSSVSSVLSDRELKNVLGGSGAGTDSCGNQCSSNSDCVKECLKCLVTENWGYQKHCYK